MRVARIRRGGQASWAVLEDAGARTLDAAPYDGGRATGALEPFTEADLLAPVVPSKIVCVGRNYAAHARELGNEVPAEPLLFFKLPSSLVGPGAAVVLPPESERVEHEAELGVVVGKRLRRASREEARAAIFGFTCACDVTARDLQKKDGQWSRAKGWDTFCPVGPWIETDLDPSDLRVRCLVDGEVKQDGRTSQMMFDVPTLLAFMSQSFTLEPGDLVLTGTPEGVSPLRDGQGLVVEIEGIGALAVRVEAERLR
jgi:2-keto-4-pentenoate hydratase/2-oxohepta-3-ene-1,7-dioic acid hydratase in catechol pathway